MYLLRMPFSSYGLPRERTECLDFTQQAHGQLTGSPELTPQLYACKASTVYNLDPSAGDFEPKMFVLCKFKSDLDLDPAMPNSEPIQDIFT